MSMSISNFFECSSDLFSTYLVFLLGFIDYQITRFLGFFFDLFSLFSLFWFIAFLLFGLGLGFLADPFPFSYSVGAYQFLCLSGLLNSSHALRILVNVALDFCPAEVEVILDKPHPLSLVFQEVLVPFLYNVCVPECCFGQ